MKKYIFLFLFFAIGSICFARSSKVITVFADKPGSSIQPTMWGIFFEDINFAADGGIYAELVKNRSFEFAKPLMGWKILKPGFLRFPGGCIVEGRDLDNRYQWKNTIGNIEDRHMIVNRWNTEFAHRQTPDYFQSFGMGFFEYFQLAEDIGAEPLPILNCGMACEFNCSYKN
jgi:alpha-L-arabinofuranosidase